MKLLELLIERATDYGKTSYELTKLKVLDKSSDVASSFIPHSVVLVLIVSFLLFFNLGLALYLGKILGEFSCLWAWQCCSKAFWPDPDSFIYQIFFLK